MLGSKNRNTRKNIAIKEIAKKFAGIPIKEALGILLEVEASFKLSWKIRKEWTDGERGALCKMVDVLSNIPKSSYNKVIKNAIILVNQGEKRRKTLR